MLRRNRVRPLPPNSNPDGKLCLPTHCKISRMRIFSEQTSSAFSKPLSPKIWGLSKKTESFSNLRTSTLCRTHISQKSWKGFSHQTRLVGRHTCELNLVYCFFGNMVGVLFLNNVPSTKKQSWNNIACCDMVISRTVSYLSNCVQDIFFLEVPFLTRLFFLYNPLPEMKV